MIIHRDTMSYSSINACGDGGDISWPVNDFIDGFFQIIVQIPDTRHIMNNNTRKMAEYVLELFSMLL